MSMADDRASRPIYSTGRGGAGNLMKSPTRGHDFDAAPGVERGRELSPHPVGEQITHSGRGGIGNIRRADSASRTRADLAADEKEDALQEKLIAERRGRQAVEGGYSTGRGGVGNISRSKSRSRSAARVGGREDGVGATPSHMHASGRGGFGNITEERGDSIDLEKEAAHKQYEADVLAKHRAAEANQPHSTGKGGAGNLHVGNGTHEPDNSSLEEREAYAKVQAQERGHYVNHGRGGAGNMTLAKDHADGDDRGRGRADGHKGGVLGNVLRSISRATGRDRSTDGRREAS
ncbi:hypothetical protein IAU60_001756 [Kwoniella sp. DSM 27419]